MEQGRIQVFHGGGGGAKDYVHAHISRARSPEVPYDRGARPALEALRGVWCSLMLSELFLYAWRVVLLSILIQNGI